MSIPNTKLWTEFFFLTHQALTFKNTFSKNYNINLKLLESS